MRSWTPGARTRLASLSLLLVVPFVLDDLAVVHALAGAFVGLCCWRD